MTFTHVVYSKGMTGLLFCIPFLESCLLIFGTVADFPQECCTLKKFPIFAPVAEQSAAGHFVFWRHAWRFAEDLSLGNFIVLPKISQRNWSLSPMWHIILPKICGRMGPIQFVVLRPFPRLKPTDCMDHPMRFFYYPPEPSVITVKHPRKCNPTETLALPSTSCEQPTT